MKTAVEVKRLEGWRGDARVFKLDPPMEWRKGWDDDAKTKKAKYVIVSATVAMFSGPETYIFPANSKGAIVDWMELAGSFRGSLDHVEALRGAGYTVKTK